MQKAPLTPAHPVRFADRILCSPDGDGHFYYGGCTRFTPSPRASPRSTPFTVSPRAPSSSSGSLVDDGDDEVATEHRLVLQYKGAPNDHYDRCLAHLADAAREAAALRVQNDELRVANSELAGRFAMLGGNQGSADLHLGQAVLATPATLAEKHALMPKSISIRSTGRGGGNGKDRVTKPMDVGSQQRVSVDVYGAKAEEHQGGGGEKRGQVVKTAGGLEFKMYRQGMIKTELCDKWEKTSACPYGDQCRFAHGIAELRPVTRHPRYKTQVCRMFASGAHCSYGHRCHFRHSITPADHLVLP